MRPRLRCASVRGFLAADCEDFFAMKKYLATGDSLRLSYLLIRRHSPFYPDRGVLSRAIRFREVRNMNQLTINKSPRNHDLDCAGGVTMAEHELTALFSAVTELFGPELAELSAEEWLQGLVATHDLPSSTRQWRRITLHICRRLSNPGKALYISN